MISQTDVEKIAKDSLGKNKQFLAEAEKISTVLYSSTDLISPETYARLEQKLVGVFSKLNVEYRRLSALRNVYFSKIYNLKRAKLAVESTKFVAGSVDREVQELLEPVLLAEAIFDGWVKSVEQMIYTCRSHTYIARRERDVC